MIKCYVAIGSNLADPIAQAESAFAALKQLPESKLIGVSSLYGSKPMGPQDQPDYVNAVACIETALSPLSLLDALQQIENTQGRQRLQRWGARTLDLDILLYGNEIMDSPRLTIPHYGMKTREFVLYPLAEIAAELIFPCGQTLQNALTHCPQNDLIILKK